MKKEFNDLENDEKKEYYILRALSVDIPYTISMIPFIVIMLITSSLYVGLGATLIFIVLSIGYFIDVKKLKKVYDL